MPSHAQADPELQPLQEGTLSSGLLMARVLRRTQPRADLLVSPGPPSPHPRPPGLPATSPGLSPPVPPRRTTAWLLLHGRHQRLPGQGAKAASSRCGDLTQEGRRGRGP